MKLSLTNVTWLVPVVLFAQEVISLSATEFDENQFIRLSNRDTWVFAKGIDASLGGINIDTSANEWKPINPNQITKELADYNGKIEGWFRIKIKTDSSFQGIPTLLYYYNYGQAIDMYVNGEYLQSFGNTGKLGGTYERLNYIDSDVFIPFEFQSGKEYLFAFHYVNQPVSFPANLLESKRDRQFSLGIAGPSYKQFIEREIFRGQVTVILTSTVCSVLTLLFFLILIQNPKEKILRLILFSSCIFSLVSIFNIPFVKFFDISYASAILFSD